MTPGRAVLAVAAGGATVVALVLGLTAPPDAVQGDAQRLMYVHVPVAWVAYLCFGVVLLAGIVGVRRGTAGPLRVARAAAELGVVLTAATLLSGSIWGRLTWGTWWVWDARVTSTVAMGLVYVAFLATLTLARTAAGRRAVSAFGIAGFAIVPVVHLSVLWWRTLHQPPTLLSPSLLSSEPNLPIEPAMAVALVSSVTAATLWGALAFAVRLSVLRRRSAAVARPEAPRQEPAHVG